MDPLPGPGYYRFVGIEVSDGGIHSGCPDEIRMGIS